MSLRETAGTDHRSVRDETDDDLYVVPAAPVATPYAGRGADALTALERQVIAIAGRDTLASLETPGRIEWLVAMVFGLRPPSRALADTRLEALRRAVVVTRHRHHMPDAVAADLRGAGFDAARVRLIEALATAG